MWKEYYKKVRWKDNLYKLTKHYEDYLAKEVEYIISNVDKKSNVLEIGCGSGRVINKIAPLAHKVIGIDNSQLQLEDSKKLLSSHSNVELRLMGGKNILFKDSSFDTVLMLFNLLGNLSEKDKIKILKEVKRVTKNGGNILVSVYSENAAPYQMEWYGHLGLKIASVTENFVSFRFKNIQVSAERFTKKKLTELFAKADLDVEIHDLAEFTYMCHAVKK